MEEMNCDRPFGLRKLDSDLLKSFNSTLKELRGLVISNIEFFQRGRSALHARFYASSCILLERTQILEPLVLEIVPHLYKFDFSEEVPGNGYRSFISLLYRCSLYLLQLCRHIHTSRSSLFFQSSRYCKDLECYVETLGQLVACLTYLKHLMAYCNDGELFMNEDNVVGDSLLLQLEMINIDCFYGRCLGFQFCETMQKALQAVLVVMATFSECYDEPSQVMQLASSLLNSGKYVLDQELRARQVVNITRTGDIKFCKAFWSIPESPIFSHLRSFTFPHVEVSDVISLDPVNFELQSTCSDEAVVITPPCAHTGPAPVQVRLISHALREGQDTTRSLFRPKTGSAKPVTLPKSPNLLFHCHGGGFVAQSSQSHENYLRSWARELEVPILSVDYSLAPDYPFPRALEECFYAYAWALKNPEKLGWTGERVCFAGDSAGANLVISTALRAVSFEIRVPDGIVSMYAPFLIQYSPSPARFMSMIDPLLPVGILMRCLAAYAGIADEFSSALAKPIFCNPGIVEPWEMVDSNEMQHIEDYIGEIKPPSADGEQVSVNEAEQADGETQTSTNTRGHSNVHTHGAENIIDEVQNQNINIDGAKVKSDNIHVQHIDESLCECSNTCRCSTNTGCELNSKAQNIQMCADNGATFSSDNNLPVNKVDLETQSPKDGVTTNLEIVAKDSKVDKAVEDDNPGYFLGDIVFVDSEMIPDVVENVDHHPASLTSSKFFSFVKKENPVKSIVSGVENPVKSLVSGVKSFISRHKKAKLSTPETDPVPTTKNVEETSVNSMEKEQFESDVDDGSPSKFKGDSNEILRDIHIKNPQGEEVSESILISKNEIKTVLTDKSENILEDVNSKMENKVDHKIHSESQDISLENITDTNTENQVEPIQRDCNKMNLIHIPLIDSKCAHNICYIQEKQTETAEHVKPESTKSVNIDTTNCQPVCGTEMEVSDCCVTNENKIETDINTISDLDDRVNKIDTSHKESIIVQRTESSHISFDESDSKEKLKINITEHGSVDDNKHDGYDDGDDDGDYDDDDAEDMEIYLESMTQHPVDTATQIISSGTGSKTQTCLNGFQNDEERKQLEDSMNAESTIVNTENCEMSVESKIFDREIVQTAVNCDKAITNVNETLNESHQTNDPDPSELYAVCQELLDQASGHGQEYGACGYNDSNMMSSSCHTIEDRSSYDFYGYDRKLSIHSEGSCDSIEDSHAWISGQDIDIVEVDSNDIVTVINDCDQNTLQDDILETNPINLDEPKFYIETSDQGYSNAHMSENKYLSEAFSETTSKDFQSETMNSGIKCLQNTDTCSSVDKRSNLKYEKNSEMENTNANDRKRSDFNLTNFEEQIAVVGNSNMSMKDDLNPVTETVTEETVNETALHILQNVLVSVDSDCTIQGDVDGSVNNDTKESSDKVRAESDPINPTTGTENNSETEMTKEDVRKLNRRAMSLDLTNDFKSFANSTDFLSQPKSLTLPRSSTVPELLSGSVTPKLFSVQRNIAQSPIQLFRRLPIVKNPYMSPILAPDDMIQGLPMVYLIACHFDPLLDDSVMFARKLQNLGKGVSLHIVDNLPHGFLNFADASPEAMQASKYCLNRIKNVLKIDVKSP